MAVKKKSDLGSQRLGGLPDVVEELQRFGSATGDLPNIGRVALEPMGDRIIGNGFGQDRLVRLKEVLEYIPVGKSTWWEGVKSGRFPAPVRHLGPRITAWRLSDILSLLQGGKP